MHDDEWRWRLNRVVREFAVRWAAHDAVPDDASVTALLREVGEALEVSSAALVGRTLRGERRFYQWREPRLAFKAPWIEAAPMQTLIDSVTHGLHPVVVSSGAHEEGDHADVANARACLRASGITTAVLVPTGLRPELRWAWVLGAADAARVWSAPLIDHLQVLGDVVAAALQRDSAGVASAVRSVGRGRLPLMARAAPPLRTTAPANRGFEEIVGDSPALQGVLTSLEEVIDTDCTVMLLGETGTGKELFARALHRRGPRRSRPMVSVNCAALPPSLIESELFGHERGAFTGAIAPRQGRFELADGGTLFLDEIGDLALDLQAKLLRVLQEGAFERVGSSQTQTVDVRIIAATHHDLARAVAENAFRADLYYRLNVFPIRVPPLRERREDIPALVWSVIEKRRVQLHRHITSVPPGVWEALHAYGWPGNIRELENVIEGALIHSTSDVLALRDGSLSTANVSAIAENTLTSVDRTHIERVLRECAWRINGTGNAAERLGLHPNTLRFRIKKLGIVRQDASHPPPSLPARSVVRRHVS